MVLFIFSMHIYIANQGSAGLSLPVNPIYWSGMALLVFAVGLRVNTKRYSFSTVAFPMFILGAAVLSVPLIYAAPSGLASAGWRVAGLFAGLVFYFSWLHVRLSHVQRQGLWLVLLMAVCGQAVLALVQMFLPDFAWVPMKGNRPYGIFQQPNVLASFVATGLALALMLFLLPGFVLRKAWHEHCRQSFLVISLLLMPALLVWTQSRVGWLGGALAALLFLWRFNAASPLRCKQAAMLMAISVLTGITMMLLSGPESNLEYIAHHGSNHARWTMLRDTLRMIAEKPLSGWGYGGFEYQFMHYRINQVPPTLVTEIASHPHNELLLWWVEGGVVALLGMGLIVSGGVGLVIRTCRQDRLELTHGSRRHAGEPIALCIVLLPMALHTQLEYPFYLSVIHFMVFLMVLATLESQVSIRSDRMLLPPLLGRILRYFLTVASVSTMVLMVFALQGGMMLTRAERSGLVDLSQVRAMPALSHWVHRDRVDFDEQVNALLTYNQIHDETLLKEYSLWAQYYLMKRIDANVYASLIPILQHQGQQAAAERFHHDGMLLFPADTRFQKAVFLPNTSREEL